MATMACQGCGKPAGEFRLCCPTCIELGRTSFFCSQDCFTKNWNAHNQLHALLKRKRSLAGEDGGATDAVAASPESAPRNSVGSVARNADTGINSLSEPLPLAGGMSMMSNVAGSQASQSRHAPAGGGGGARGGSSAVSMGANVLGSLVGQAKSMFGGSSSGGSEKDKQGAQLRLRSPAMKPRLPMDQDRGGRSRSPGKGGRSPGSPTASTRQAAIPIALGVLVLVSITAGMMFYREHETYADGTELQVALPVADPAVADSAAEAQPPPRDVPAASASGDEEALRSDIAQLRQSLSRHEQMLRYIMNRYVEKGEDRKNLPGMESESSAVEHDVGAASMTVNYSQPESVSKSYAEPDGDFASRVSALRKRGSGGGDTIG